MPKKMPVYLIYQEKALTQYDSEGYPVKTYNTIDDASRAIKRSPLSIYACLINDSPSVGGFIWKYGANQDRLPLDEYENAIVKNQQLWNNKELSQYTTTGQHIATYPSIKEASIKTGIDRSAISQNANKLTKSSGGYIWRHGSSKRTLDLIDQKIKALPTSNKAIDQYDRLGNLVANYASITEASQKTGVTRSNIGAQLCERSSHAGGFIWKYANQ